MSKKLLITFNNRLFDLLKNEKERSGATMAEIIRRALKMYLSKNKND